MEHVIELVLEDGPLGVRIENSSEHLVASVADGSLADKSGVLPGDRLCAVGKTELYGLAHEEAMDLVVSSSKPVHLIFRRPTAPSEAAPVTANPTTEQSSVFSAFQSRMASSIESMRHGSRRLSKAVATAFRDSRSAAQLSIEPHSASVPAGEVAHHHFPPLNAARASFLDAWQEVRAQQAQVQGDGEQLAGALQAQLRRMQQSHTQHGRAREALNMHLPQLLSGVQGCLAASEALRPQLLQVQQQLRDAQVALKQRHLAQRARSRADSARATHSTDDAGAGADGGEGGDKGGGGGAVKAQTSGVTTAAEQANAAPSQQSDDDGTGSVAVGSTATPARVDASPAAVSGATTVTPAEDTGAETAGQQGEGASVAQASSAPDSGSNKRKKKRKGGKRKG